MQVTLENKSDLSDIRDRIKSIQSSKGWTNKGFADLLGVSPQSLHDIVAGKRSMPGSSLLIKIASEISDVNPAWLLTGLGEPFQKVESAEERNTRMLKEHLEKNPVPPPKPVSATVARNNEKRRQQAMELREPVALYGKEVELSFPKEPNVIPLNVEVAAGGNACMINTNNQVAGQAVSFPGITGSTIRYAIRVYGESMQPTLSNGDVIIIEESSVQKPGRIYAVASSDNIAWVKRFREELGGNLLFESDNLEHEGLTIKRSEVYQCFEVLAKYSTNLNQNNSGVGLPSEWQRRLVRLEQDMRLVKGV